jgi:nucleoside-diphosphate-sugar epimerase
LLTLSQNTKRTSLHRFEPLSQIVIYGANGWLGRSAIASAMQLQSMWPDLSLLLIGSKPSRLAIDGKVFDIQAQAAAAPLIQRDCLFLNAAFLRREKLFGMSYNKYIDENAQISSFALEQIKSNRVQYFINLSSGAAKPYDLKSVSLTEDPYGSLKFLWEKEFEEACRVRNINFLNCRIYSILGRFINEFDNLAISSFFLQSLEEKSIIVEAPNCRRTYVDAEQLVTLLFKLVLQAKSMRIDSGGTLTTLESLAMTVLEVLNLESGKLIRGNSISADYFGDYEQFNSLCDAMEIGLLDINAQVKKTSIAFNQVDK